MKNNLLFPLLTIIILASFNCSKTSSCHYAAEPPIIFLQIKKNGKFFNSDTLIQIKLSYIKNGVKTYLNDLTEATDLYSNKGILTSREFGVSSIYLIEYPYGLTTDTLFINLPTASPETNCQYFIKEVKFNNSVVTPDNSLGAQPVYVFNKT